MRGNRVKTNILKPIFNGVKIAFFKINYSHIVNNLTFFNGKSFLIRLRFQLNLVDCNYG